MQYTSLGRSGLQVSGLALGAMNFRELTDQTAAFQIMDYIGSSIFAGWDIATAQSVAASRHFLRGYNGQQSRWYQAAIHQKAGRIRAAGMTKDVVFEPVDETIHDRIDEAYRTKYAGSPYLKAMIGGRPRAATVGVLPRG